MTLHPCKEKGLNFDDTLTSTDSPYKRVYMRAL